MSLTTNQRNFSRASLLLSWDRFWTDLQLFGMNFLPTAETTWKDTRQKSCRPGSVRNFLIPRLPRIERLRKQNPRMMQQFRSTRLQRVLARVLATFGSILSRIRPLDWYPGWRFGAGESGAGVIGRLRLAPWEHFKNHQLCAPFTIRWYDRLKIRLYLGNDLSRALYVGGTYEPNEFMFLSRVLRQGMTFIDVGANDGLYTLFAASRVGSKGRVISIEPSERENTRLQRNIRLNRLTNVLTLRKAASDREGIGILRIAEAGHAGQNTLGNFAYPIGQEGTEQVPLTTLDIIVKESGVEHVDIIKIDVEGGELAVLKGAHDVVTAHRPLILIELVEAALLHQGANRKAVLALLQSMEYRFWIFGPTGPPNRLHLWIWTGSISLRRMRGLKYPFRTAEARSRQNRF